MNQFQHSQAPIRKTTCACGDESASIEFRVEYGTGDISYMGYCCCGRSTRYYDTINQAVASLLLDKLLEA